MLFKKYKISDESDLLLKLSLFSNKLVNLNFLNIIKNTHISIIITLLNIKLKFYRVFNYVLHKYL